MKKEPEKPFNYEALIQLSGYIGGILLMVTGVILIVLKFFGFPLLFEGVSIFVLGYITYTVVQNRSLMSQTIETFSEVLHMAKPKQVYKPIYPQQPPGHSFAELFIDASAPPEQLEKMKQDYPQLAGIIDALTKFSPQQKKDLNSMTVKELEQKLSEAIETDDFETAAVIRDLINKKKSE